MTLGKRFDVTVAGELNMDLVLYGLPQELPPEREHLASRLQFTLGSSSAIFAHNLSVLGSRVGFIARISRDLFGETSLKRLAESGTDVSRVIELDKTNGGTGLTVVLPCGSERRILTYSGTTFGLRFEDLDFDYLTSGRHFHMASFFLHRGLAPRMTEIFRTIKSAGVTISLDPNDDPADTWGGAFFEVLPYVDILFMNEREARAAARTDHLPTAMEQFAEAVPTVVIKRGREGALARSAGKEFSASALSINPVDSIGAGDSFDAGFVHWYLRGGDVPTCLKYANASAAFSLTCAGGTEAFVSRETMDKFFREHVVSD